MNDREFIGCVIVLFLLAVNSRVWGYELQSVGVLLMALMFIFWYDIVKRIEILGELKELREWLEEQKKYYEEKEEDARETLKDSLDEDVASEYFYEDAIEANTMAQIRYFIEELIEELEEVKKQ